LKAREKFTEMIDQHRVGITACRKLQNKIARGLVEGLSKEPPHSARAHGLCDAEYPG
jgi:hypothetical protein